MDRKVMMIGAVVVVIALVAAGAAVMLNNNDEKKGLYALDATILDVDMGGMSGTLRWSRPSNTCTRPFTAT